MSQWKSNPRVLIVHGGGGPENEDSYITIVAVPNLGCLDCKKLRDECFSDMYEGKGESYIDSSLLVFEPLILIVPFQQIVAEFYVSNVT